MKEMSFDETRRWLCDPDNSCNCDECPMNEEFSSWPGTRLPCGQFQCWVDVNNKDSD